ncbi:MAG: hypothetical protein H6Q52_1931 [Deltaproteobacteria bacterium]|nr:hypothetical protein [Deltaproteobacteria bacterium]
MPTIPAIQNGIYDAAGFRINELPVTSDKALHGNKGRKEIGGSHVSALYTELGY